MTDAISREEGLRHQMIALLPRMRRFARGLTRELDRADSLVQEACERALSRLDQIREDTRLDSWLYRIIYTRWIDRLRRQKVRTAHLVALSTENVDSVRNVHFAEHLETALDMKAALASLPEEHRVAMLLVGVEGYSYSETAAVMNIPIGTVASRVARARNMLGRLLSHRKRHVFPMGNQREKETGP